MQSRAAWLVLPILLIGCSDLDTLTEEVLVTAEQRWRDERPGLYRLVVEMSGERVETSVFDALVRDGQVVSLKRNGTPILPDRGDDYSMEGFFRILRQELMLSEEPSLMGAAPGFAAHLLVSLDDETGRLKSYRRTVGGANNKIQIEVIGYTPH